LELLTNGGIPTSRQKTIIPEWGEAWFNAKSITNIFSYFEMKSQYIITSDLAREKSFNDHLTHTTIKFTETPQILYVYMPSSEESSTLRIMESSLTN